MILNTAEELFSSSLNYISLDQTAIQEAEDRFAQFQKAGVIKNHCSFKDQDWFTTDEYANIGLHFQFEAFSYKKYESIFELPYADFIAYVKAYLISLLGKYALSSIRTVLLDLRRIISTDISAIYGATDSVQLSNPLLCAEFLSMLPNSDDNEDIERLIDAMDSYADINFGKQVRSQRSLADFDTYFLFNDIMQDYWKSPLTEDERMYYYPLYLWWKITGVIPKRPREFLLTERNCLSIDEKGNYFLNLRQNQLKGRNRKVEYRLDKDYLTIRYKIPISLGKEIERYIIATNGFENTDIDTLFKSDFHYRKWGHKKHSNSRFLTYANMNTILRCFYKEVICEKYGLRIKGEHTGGHLADGEIGYIHLGDTRHIALINIIQEGGTPLTAMLLAGHSDMNTASHYYSNLANLIECKTYRKYRSYICGETQYRISTGAMIPEARECQPLSDGGRCYSEHFKEGSIADCMSAIGENGEIGYCPTCQYYRKGGASYFGSDDIYKRQMKDDCTALRDAIAIVRQGKGCIEDIGEALLKLRASSISYESYLMEKKLKNSEEG